MTDVIRLIRTKVDAIRRAMAASASNIGEIREAIDALRTEREAIRSAAVPVAEARAALHQLLDQWGAAGTPEGIHLDYLVGQAAAGHQPTIELYRATSLGTVFAVLAPLLRGPLRAGVDEALDAHYAAVRPGLPAPERARRLAEVDADLLKLEALEEAAISAAAEGGLQIDRRPDADPRALLGIAE